MSKDRQHFIPASYLVGFADKLDRTGQLFVYDLKEKKRFKSSIENAGVIKGYYKIDLDGHHEDEIEDIFAEVETRAITILRKMINTLQFPSESDFKTLLRFVSSFGIRVPHIRNNFTRFVTDVLKLSGQVYFANTTEEDFQETAMRERIDLGETTFEELKSFALGGKYTATLEQNYQIGNMLKLWYPIYSMLLRRNWYLLYRPDNFENYFITSDCPLTIVSEDIRIAAGFGIPGTKVLFPLNRDVILTGVFEDVPARVIRANNRLVRINNTFMAVRCDRFLYSYTEEFGLAKKNFEHISSSVMLVKNDQQEV